MSKLERWDVEDEQFWEESGKKVAYRNLWISIPNLLCGFSVWLYWGMLAKFIQKIHFASPEAFNFTPSASFGSTATADSTSCGGFGSTSCLGFGSTAVSSAGTC